MKIGVFRGQNYQSNQGHQHVRKCPEVLYFSVLSVPESPVLVRMYISLPGCPLQNGLFISRMYNCKSGCIVPCQDVLFPLRMDYFLLPCCNTFFSVSVTQYHDLYNSVLEEFILFRNCIDLLIWTILSGVAQIVSFSISDNVDLNMKIICEDLKLI